MVSFLDSEHPRMKNAVEVISKQMQKYVLKGRLQKVWI
jgi:hypothetical protein